MEQFMMYKDSLLLFYELKKKLKTDDLISGALISLRYSSQPTDILQENDMHCLFICLEFEKEYLQRVISEQEYINTLIDFYSSSSNSKSAYNDTTRKRKWCFE